MYITTPANVIIVQYYLILCHVFFLSFLLYIFYFSLVLARSIYTTITTDRPRVSKSVPTSLRNKTVRGKFQELLLSSRSSSWLPDTYLWSFLPALGVAMPTQRPPTHRAVVFGAHKEDEDEHTDSCKGDQLLGPLSRVESQPQDKANHRGSYEHPESGMPELCHQLSERATKNPLTDRKLGLRVSEITQQLTLDLD